MTICEVLGSLADVGARRTLRDCAVGAVDVALACVGVMRVEHAAEVQDKARQAETLARAVLALDAEVCALRQELGKRERAVESRVRWGRG